MALVRKASKTVPNLPDQVVKAIHRAIGRGQASYTYCDLVETKDPPSLRVTIKPNWWPLVLTTQLTLDVTQLDGQRTELVATTTSQWFILGDLANMYDGYLRDILQATATELDQDG